MADPNHERSMGTVTPKRPSICITTYFDDNFKDVGELCVRSLRHYAERHDCAVVLHNDISCDRPPPWCKILVLQKILAEQACDYVLWVDADALFARYDRDIREEIEAGKELYMVKHISGQKQLPNTGVLLLSNTEWSKQFLDDIWNMTAYTHHPWWENAAVMDYLGYSESLEVSKGKVLAMGVLNKIGMVDVAIRARRWLKAKLSRLRIGVGRPRGAVPNGDSEPGARRDQMVKWLDELWNVFADTKPHPQAIVHHYPARSLEVRVARMTRDLKAIDD